MFKRLVFVIFIISSLFVIIWSSNYVLQKQLKSLNYFSFSVSDSASFIYVPNANILINKASQVSLPKEVINKDVYFIFKQLNQLNQFDFNSNVSAAVFLSFDNTNLSVVFNNYDLTIEGVKQYLKNELDISAEITEQTIKINDYLLYYNRAQAYFVISTTQINPKSNHLVLKDVGNYDYLFQKNSKSNPIYFKYTPQHILSFCLTEQDTIKGQPINTNKYFKFIPANFDTAYIYSSSRFKEDITTLSKQPKQSDFYNWINKSLMHIKKGALELIIGEQNNNQYLKDILDEQTLEMSSDSLLPTPIYKNNYEIHFFKSNYNWQALLQHNSAEYNVFTEFNNLNIIANSSDAIDWYIKEMQLGNIYLNKANSIPFLSKSHYTQIVNSDSLINIIEKVWVNKTKCFNSKITTNQTEINAQENILLQNKFFTDFNVEGFNTYVEMDSIYIIGYNNNSMVCYNHQGKQLWENDLKSNLISNPQIIVKDKPIIVVFQTNKIITFDLKKGKILKHFPIQLNQLAKTGVVLKYDEQSDYRFIVNEGNQIHNYTIEGNPVKGWNNYQISGQVKGQIQYQSNKGKDYIYFTDNFDTVHVLNRQGNSRFEQHYKVNLPNQSKYITGDIEKGNLRCLGYHNNYIISHFLNDGHKDSLKVNITTQSPQINWIKKANKTYLIIEEYDKVYILNEFGLIENEILKPQPNLVYLNPQIKSNNVHLFANINNNDLYLLNNFGKQINTQPIKGNANTNLNQLYLVSYVNSKFWIYKLKNK